MIFFWEAAHGEELNWGLGHCSPSIVLPHRQGELQDFPIPHFQFLTAISSDFSTWMENEAARGPHDSFCSDGRNFQCALQTRAQRSCSPHLCRLHSRGYGGQMWVSSAKRFVMVPHRVGMKALVNVGKQMSFIRHVSQKNQPGVQPSTSRDHHEPRHPEYHMYMWFSPFIFYLRPRASSFLHHSSASSWLYLELSGGGKEAKDRDSNSFRIIVHPEHVSIRNFSSIIYNSKTILLYQHYKQDNSVVKRLL